MAKGCTDCVKPLLLSVRAKLPQSLLTYGLFCVFGIGSWVAVNGLWAEISILTRTLPECNCLPAVLVVVIQLANVGPLLYTLVQGLCQRHGCKLYRLEVSVVFTLVCVGTVSCVCLALFWDKTSVVGGANHSVSLVVISLCLALVDCTSSVVFLPFMKHFPSQYVSALYIGEGLSGVLPSVVALSQGFVNNSLPTCLHGYSSYSDLGLNFSPNVFFVFLTCMMLVCGLAFLLINTLPPVKRLMLPTTPDHNEQSEQLIESKLTVQVTTPHTVSALKTALQHLWTHRTLYVCLGLVNFLTNGALSAISAVALFPYGSEVYHTAINLALLATPLACVVFVLLPHKSPVFTAVLTSLSCLLGVYMLTAAVLDPPPLNTLLIGKIVIVSSSSSVCVCTATHNLPYCYFLRCV